LIAFSKDIDAIEDMNLVKLIQLSHLFINFQLPRNHREIAEGHNNLLEIDSNHNLDQLFPAASSTANIAPVSSLME
jgi:hypothetical protein